MTERGYAGLLDVAHSYTGVPEVLEKLSTWAKPAQTSLEPHDGSLDKFLATITKGVADAD